MAINENVKPTMQLDGNTNPVAALAPRLASAITITSGAVSSPLKGGVYRLFAPAETKVAIGSGDIAGGSDFTLPTGFVEYVRIHPDQTISSTGGNLEVCICD